MELIPFRPNMKIEDLWVNDESSAVPAGTRVTVEVNGDGMKAGLTHILPDGFQQQTSVVYDDCNVHGPTLSWISDNKVVFCTLYRINKITRLVGVIHDPNTRPVEEWVAEDDGGSVSPR